MKQFSEQLHKKATTTVKLQAAEKRELRERLVAYMEYHPLPAAMKAPASKPRAEQVASEAFTMVKVPFHALFKYGAIAAAFVLVVIPFVAEKAVPGDARFCPHCGHQQIIFSQCENCGKNLPPNARFCSKCGTQAGGKPVSVVCGHCKTENLPGSVFCNQCGERL